MAHPMMACGHAANATDAEGKPVCAICIGIVEGADVIAETPNLDGRMARCSYYYTCKHERTSNINLPFFSHRPDKEHDEYYCGCHGWD